MELELRHLRALVAIADAHSLVRAAKTLHVSQPALSGLLRRVERSVGGSLFARSPTGCVPTALGEDVVADARAVLAGMSALTERAGARRESAEAVRIGGYSGFLHLSLARWLRDQPWCPAVRVHEEQDEARTVAALADGELDLALVYLAPLPDRIVSDGVESVVIQAREPVFVILAEDHPLASGEDISLEELAAYPWADDPPWTTRWSAYLREVCRQRGVVLDQPHRPQCLATLLDLVREGMAVAPALATREDRQGGIVVRAIEDAPLWQELRLCYRQGTAVADRIGEISQKVTGDYANRQGCSAAFDRWWHALLPAGA